MQASQEISNSPPEDHAPQGYLETGSPTGEIVNSGTSRSDRSLQITPRPIGFGSSLSGKGLLQYQDTMNGVTSSFLLTLSLKKKFTECNGERSPLLNSEPAPNLPPSVSRSVSGSILGRGSVQAPVSRSLSVPGRNCVIVRSFSFATHGENGQMDTFDDEVTPVPLEENDEEIPEEEAIWGICYGACDEGNTLMMECSCKGSLRGIIDEECIVKWFRMRGRKQCDVCGQEISNLPVILLRAPTSMQINNMLGHNPQNLNS
ncbi:probable E3 ubiquitin ligase SUD1 isoform X1 [Diospyros lotus]|uniref:probable E3 ubiquitin ligase SUD1 isoform X1 n=1 Tax=Diospyros lotus TaxID=55363 RepID=UPI0022598E30|nr:probable E3 ubiquitin ligase SUD1 isoform X1 [Diospyros lotus]